MTKTNFQKIALYILQVILTALASAGIAILQSYLETHGVPTGPVISPENTGVIGGAVASGRIAINQFKNNCIL